MAIFNLTIKEYLKKTLFYYDTLADTYFQYDKEMVCIMNPHTLKAIQKIKKKINNHYQNGQYHLVLEETKKALALDNSDYEAMCTAAMACMEIGDNDEALKFAVKMLEIREDYLYGHIVLAKIYYLQLEYDKTIMILQKLFLNYIKVMPNIIKQLGYSLLGNVYIMLGDIENGCEKFLQASTITDDINIKSIEYSKYLLSLHYKKVCSTSTMFTEHIKYEGLFKQVKQFQHLKKIDKEKINIGYISADFRYHIVVFFCYALLSKYNHDRYTVTCYSKGMEDGVTAQLKNLVTVWRDISKLNPDEAAKVIFMDGIDILVDLSGHTDNNCLPILARKPAPIQVSGIGYFNTTGLTAIDYFIADSYCDPEEINDELFVEKIIRLPHSHLCYTARADIGEASLPAVNKNNFITFGCFNNFSKITDDMLLVWQSILSQVKNAKLILKSKVFGSTYACDQIRKRLLNLGFSLEKIEFRPASVDYLMQYNDIDIALDTFPYPGGGTTCEALYMGVPVITLAGTSHGARFGYSILKNIGLDECIAFSEKEYVEKTVTLATDVEKINNLHQTLRSKIMNSAVMNEKQYVSEVEESYEKMWEELVYIKQQARSKKSVMIQNSKKINELKIELLQAWRNQDYSRTISLAKAVLQYNLEDYEILYVLAEVYYNMKKFDQAKKFAERVIAIKKDYVKAYYLLGMVYFVQPVQTLNSAKIIQIFKEMFELNLDLLDLNYQSRAYIVLAQMYWDLEDIDKSIEYYKKADVIETNQDTRRDHYSDYLFELNHSANLTQQDIFVEHEKYSEFFADIIPYEHVQREKKEKLRIGYISPDFRVHPVTYFALQLLLEYDKKKFEVYCYSNTKKPDSITERLKKLVNKWQDISKFSYKEAADLIYQDKIDILVDLSGHTANSVLPILAYKPAPIQVSGIGYVNTTGLKAVDYFITDQYCDPVGLNDSYFTEKLLRLPHTHFCYTGNSEAPLWKEAPSLKNGYITFGSFNKFNKVSAITLELWAEILKNMPTAKLVLKAKAFSTEYGKKLAKEKLLQAGICECQLELRPISWNYMLEYNDIDIALDTYPCAGGTTTLEALYMSVPVITLAGDRHVSRFGYSILKNLAFEDGIAYTKNEYVDKAVKLAHDTSKVYELHRTLRQKLLNSPLMNGKQYAVDMETEYIKIWDEAFTVKFDKNNKSNKNNKSDKLKNSKFNMDKINILKQKIVDYKAQENYEEAMLVITELFEMEYYNSDIIYQLAEIYYITGDLERAAVWGKKIIALDAKYADAYILLAKIYTDNNMPELFAILNCLAASEFLGKINEVDDIVRNIDLNLYEDEIRMKYENLYQYIVNKKELNLEIEPIEADKENIDLNHLKNLLQNLNQQAELETTLSELVDKAFVYGLTDQIATNFKNEKIEKLIDEVLAYGSANENKLQLLNDIAVKFYEYNCLDKVMSVLVKALELDQHDDVTLKNLGAVLFKVGEKELALQYLKKISQKDIAVIDFIKRSSEAIS